MPSIGDIANQSKALLEKIDVNTKETKTNTASTDNHVVQLIGVSQTGFSNLSQGMAVQIALQKQTNDLLDLNARQNETIVCWLKNMAEELCTIARNTTKEVELQKQLNGTLSHLDKILELVYAREAIEVLKRTEIEQRLGKCCPEKEEPLVPCYKECELPKYVPPRPLDIKWKPLEIKDHKPQ
jgi:phosphate starvation-inducible protein PhoH